MTDIEWFVVSYVAVVLGFLAGQTGLVLIALVATVLLVINASMSVWFWLVIGPVLLFWAFNSTMKNIPEDDRIIDRSNRKQQNTINSSVD